MDEPDVQGHLLPVLTGGFTLLVLLLIASVVIGVGAMQSSEAGAARLLDEQRATMRLIADVQRDEESVSSVFYSLATRPTAAERERMLAQLDALQPAIPPRFGRRA